MTTDTAPTFDYETDYGTSGYVIGVDEAGRGPWAGPVCASAFWIHPDKLATIPAALTDSKKLSAKKRAEIETALKNGPHHFTAAMASVGEIDELGILQANFKAMAQAIDELADTLLSQDPLGLADKGLCQISCVLIDGNLKPKISYPCEAIIKGDGRVLSIAAASIIAKQTRDHHMAALHASHPVYGWDSNQGYGTKVHREAIAQYGITDHHRRSFAPIKKYIEEALS